MEIPNLLIRDVEKTLKSLIKKLTHSGEDELNKESLRELRQICRVSKDDIIAFVAKVCFRCMKKEHSQVRLACVKLFNYLFQKSHIIRLNLINRLDIYLELALAISLTPDVELKLPPPKSYASLLKEISAKFLHQWYTDYGPGYERLRYTYKYLQEHGLVDFSQFRVRTHEQLINDKRLKEKQERIMSQSIQNRLNDFAQLKPEIDQVIVQIESILDALIPNQSDLIFDSEQQDICNDSADDKSEKNSKNLHGFVNLNTNIDINFSPFLQLVQSPENREVLDTLRELKRQLVSTKLPKLIGIEKVINKRSDQFLDVLRKIIDLKTKCTASLQRLSEIQILDENKNQSTTLDRADNESDNSDEFEEVPDKEDLESYIPKNLRYEYGLVPIDPRELDENKSTKSRTILVDESFSAESEPIPSTSSATLTLPCNVKLESGKLCPRRDKVKCPFHGRIIARDHNGLPIDEEERRLEEKKAKKKSNVPDWQDPELLEDIRLATGIDLKMPEKGKRKPKEQTTKLLDKKTCDVTPKQRLQKRLKKLGRL